MVTVVAHLDGLVPGVPKYARKVITAITVWNPASVRTIFSFVIQPMVASAGTVTQVRIATFSYFPVMFGKRKRPVTAA